MIDIVKCFVILKTLFQTLAQVSLQNFLTFKERIKSLNVYHATLKIRILSLNFLLVR